MNKQLVTCPVCKSDQHVYANAICNHDDGILRCSGSRMKLNKHLRSFNAEVEQRIQKHMETAKEMKKDTTNFEQAVRNGDYNKKPNCFKDDLLAYFEVSGDKADKAYWIAYSERHSSGFAEVMDMFSDLVELIK